MLDWGLLLYAFAGYGRELGISIYILTCTNHEAGKHMPTYFKMSAGALITTNYM